MKKAEVPVLILEGWLEMVENFMCDGCKWEVGKEMCFEDDCGVPYIIREMQEAIKEAK